MFVPIPSRRFQELIYKREISTSQDLPTNRQSIVLYKIHDTHISIVDFCLFIFRLLYLFIFFFVLLILFRICIQLTRITLSSVSVSFLSSFYDKHGDSNSSQQSFWLVLLEIKQKHSFSDTVTLRILNRLLFLCINS